FSASLLILYEGSIVPHPPTEETRVDVRMVDFARAYNSTENHLEPESYYSIGRIIDTFQKLLNTTRIFVK
ncbi:inositol polyphosphate kinase family protein, partial [Salmonella sp. s51228]|uniref:inositol polyphosphate kinase family protein n=1 Tax=Salmonella sp. s51228 TaxID=3159652 RepID=UPI003980D1A9